MRSVTATSGPAMKTVEVDSSHLVMLAHPERVAQLIEEAVRATAH